MAINRSDLVVLIYANNNCYTEVILADDPKLKNLRTIIDENEGTWTAPHNSDPAKAPQTMKIGGSRYFDPGCRYGVIGVYDRTKLEHLNHMVNDGQKATDNTRPCDID